MTTLADNLDRLRRIVEAAKKADDAHVLWEDYSADASQYGEVFGDPATVLLLLDALSAVHRGLMGADYAKCSWCGGHNGSHNGDIRFPTDACTKMAALEQHFKERDEQ